METTELHQHQRLQEALRDFLWDQWVALGLAGHASGKPVPFVIDPEALLLATLRFAMDEGRFRGEVLDWLTQNGALLSVQRMKNFDLSMRVAPPESVRALAAFMEKAGYRNWKTLQTRVSSGAKLEFSESTGRGMSQAPDSARPEAFLLRMRMLFGVNARAEVITWLLTHTDGHAARIARETGWFSKSVQAILNDLEQAGMLIARTEGKRKEVTLHPRGDIWHPDLAMPLHWFSQAPFYLGIHHVLRTLEQANQPELSAAARAITIRRDLVPLETSFRLAGLGDLYTGANKERGEALIERFMEATHRLVEMVETRVGLSE
ncbi:MAG: hypothetical protein V4689_05790 [Verrucomicrobiota bacterium]